MYRHKAMSKTILLLYEKTSIKKISSIGFTKNINSCTSHTKEQKMKIPGGSTSNWIYPIKWKCPSTQYIQ